jgi:predicted negative regulator of RcsB-dependent stress response
VKGEGMKKTIAIIVIIAVVIGGAFIGYKTYQKHQIQKTRETAIEKIENALLLSVREKSVIFEN